MSFLDVAFLPSLASFSTTFHKNCGKGDSLRTTSCLRTVVEAKQGHAPYKILLLHKAFFVSVEFNGDHYNAHKDEVKSGHAQFWGYYRI